MKAAGAGRTGGRIKERVDEEGETEKGDSHMALDANLIPN